MEANTKDMTINIPDCHVDEAIFIRQKDIRKKIVYTNILWVEAEGSYCDFHLITGDIITVIHSLIEIETYLPRKLFLRIHRSHIVNVHHVDGLIGNMVIIGKTKLPVSSPYCKSVALCFDILEQTETLFKYRKREKKTQFKKNDL